MKYIVVSKILTRILSISIVAFFVCALIAIDYHEPIKPFMYSAAIAFILAGFLFLTSKDKELTTLNKKAAYLSVAFAWFLISLVGSLPFIFSGYFASNLDAFFESVSGFTTTGASILPDIESLPKSILFWRSLTHWIGGIGIIVLVILIMPALKIGSYNLFTLESSLPEKIHPRIQSVGKRLLFIYVLLTIAEIVFLLFGHMPLYDSVCHAFGTISTGGFSPKNTSIAGYTPYLQYVVMIFMLLGGTNFIIHYYFLKRRFRKIKENEELRFYLSVIIVSGFLVTAILLYNSDRPFELAFRESFFQVISIITCTGFATSDYLLWPRLGWAIIFLLMFFGGSMGSTAGGIKMARHLIAVKNIKNTFYKLMHPNSVHIVKLNSKVVSYRESNSTMMFILWYIMSFLIGSYILVIMGVDGTTALSSIATAMGGIGPGLGSVGPASNFAHLPQAAKFVIMLFMILGRLEIYPVLILFAPFFWKKQ